MRILIRATLILLLLDAALLGIAGARMGNRWLLGGAAVAVLLGLVVLRVGRGYERRRADVAAARTELRAETHGLAAAIQESRDS